jgi:hypothetical protein
MEERQAGRHQQHERSADQHPCNITRVDCGIHGFSFRPTNSPRSIPARFGEARTSLVPARTGPATSARRSPGSCGGIGVAQRCAVELCRRRVGTSGPGAAKARGSHSRQDGIIAGASTPPPRHLTAFPGQ